MWECGAGQHEIRHHHKHHQRQHGKQHIACSNQVITEEGGGGGREHAGHSLFAAAQPSFALSLSSF